MLPFTFEERKQIEKLLKDGHNFSSIHTITGRSKNGIATEVRKNGGPYEYDAVKAQKKSEKVHEEKKTNMSEKMKNQPESFGMHRRIVELEEKVSVLRDEVIYLYKKLLPMPPPLEKKQP